MQIIVETIILGTKWHTRRKLLTPAFHFDILRQFINVFNEETCKLAQKFSESEEVVDVVPPLTNVALHSIVETALGLDNIDHSVQHKYKETLHNIDRVLIQRLCSPWYAFNFIYKMTKLTREESSLVAVLHGISNTIIKNREEEMVNVSSHLSTYSKKKRLAMLDLLLVAKNEGFDIDHEGIREELDLFIFGGHDTISMAISFLFLILANLQDIQNRIVDEMLSVLGSEKLPSYEDLQHLKYTERCIKETLRLFPSVPSIFRIASETFTTKTGYLIPKGTPMEIHIFDSHRNENIYPDPLKFDPDRFLPENVKGRHPFAYIPFSAGPRNCIGQRFALLELKCILCGVLRKFKLEKIDDINEVEFRLDLVLRPKKNITVRILPRV